MASKTRTYGDFIKAFLNQSPYLGGRGGEGGVFGKKREVGNSGDGDQEGNQKSMVLKGGEDGKGRERILQK